MFVVREKAEHFRQEEEGTTEDGMVGWHRRRDGHESEPAPGDGEGQGGLACCRPWGHRGLGTTERLNDNRWEGSRNRRDCRRRETGCGAGPLWAPRVQAQRLACSGCVCVGGASSSDRWGWRRGNGVR